jgi:hypothetical protein
MRSRAPLLSLALPLVLGLETQPAPAADASDPTPRSCCSSERIKGTFGSFGQGVSEEQRRTETERQAFNRADTASDDGYYCSVPLTGAAPDEFMERTCASFKDQDSCLAYTNVERFPYKCVWINEQYWRNGSRFP